MGLSRTDATSTSLLKDNITSGNEHIARAARTGCPHQRHERRHIIILLGMSTPALDITYTASFLSVSYFCTIPTGSQQTRQQDTVSEQTANLWVVGRCIGSNSSTGVLRLLQRIFLYSLRALLATSINMQLSDLRPRPPGLPRY